MTKIKLTDGTIINASSVEVVNGTLKITTNEYSVEELAEIFKDKNKTNLITLMTESEKVSGYKTGFTSFAGINYDADGNKTVELFQPKDVTESRLSNVEGTVAQLTTTTENKILNVENSVSQLTIDTEDKILNVENSVSQLIMDTENKFSNVENSVSQLTIDTDNLSVETNENSENIVDVQAQVDYIVMMSDIEM